LLETSDLHILDEQNLPEQDHFVESPRKDSLGCDLFVDHSMMEPWEKEKLDQNLPTTGISSDLFDVEVDDSWPCLIRIPSPGLPEVDDVFKDPSGENLMQDTYPHPGCGILPSCSSSSPSGDVSRSVSPGSFTSPWLYALPSLHDGITHEGIDLLSPGVRSTPVSDPPTTELSHAPDLEHSWLYPEQKVSPQLPNSNNLVSLPQEKKSKGRGGPLVPDRRPRIHEMRAIKACSACRSRKIRCSGLHNSYYPHSDELGNHDYCVSCFVRSVKEQPTGPTLSNNNQVRHLLELICYHSDEVYTRFYDKLKETFQQMQREEAPFSFDQLLDKIREQFEGDLSERFNEILDQLRQEFLETTPERRLLL
jgi:hypothetical protein